jgi:hypothetical protein
LTLLLYCPCLCCHSLPSYCAVHVYVVIHLCGSMWSFWVEANLCRFFLSFVYVLPLEIQLSRGEGWDTINRFNPATFLCLSQARI